jgi:hypothetical protein
MRVIPQTQPEVRETVELTGQEIQLIRRALEKAAPPEDVMLQAAEIRLLTAFEELQMNNDLEWLEK